MEIVNSINDALWSYVITIVLVGAAIYFTVRSRGVQFRFLKDALRIMAGQSKDLEAEYAKYGVRVEWVPLDNLIGGYGAAHCMTQVLNRGK